MRYTVRVVEIDTKNSGTFESETIFAFHDFESNLILATKTMASTTDFKLIRLFASEWTRVQQTRRF